MNTHNQINVQIVHFDKLTKAYNMKAGDLYPGKRTLELILKFNY